MAYELINRLKEKVETDLLLALSNMLRLPGK